MAAVAATATTLAAATMRATGAHLAADGRIPLAAFAPAAAGDDVSSKVGLIASHLLAATIIGPVLTRQTTR